MGRHEPECLALQTRFFKTASTVHCNPASLLKKKKPYVSRIAVLSGSRLYRRRISRDLYLLVKRSFS